MTEVQNHLIRNLGVDEDEAVLSLGLLGLLEPVLIDELVGTTAGLLRAAHYHRLSRAVGTVGRGSCCRVGVSCRSRGRSTR